MWFLTGWIYSCYSVRSRNLVPMCVYFPWNVPTSFLKQINQPPPLPLHVISNICLQLIHLTHRWASLHSPLLASRSWRSNTVLFCWLEPLLTLDRQAIRVPCGALPGQHGKHPGQSSRCGFQEFWWLGTADRAAHVLVGWPWEDP